MKKEKEAKHRGGELLWRTVHEVEVYLSQPLFRRRICVVCYGRLIRSHDPLALKLPLHSSVLMLCMG